MSRNSYIYNTNSRSRISSSTGNTVYRIMSIANVKKLKTEKMKAMKMLALSFGLANIESSGIGQSMKRCIGKRRFESQM